ncbi:metallopeptidase TldD-related protein [Candidatus Riflebacteria bacterium]
MSYQLLTTEQLKIKLKFEKNSLTGMEVRNSCNKTFRMMQDGKLVTIFGERETDFSHLKKRAEKYLPYGRLVDYEFPELLHLKERKPPCTDFFKSLNLEEMKEVGLKIVSRLSKDFPDQAVDLELFKIENNIHLENSAEKRADYLANEFHAGLLLSSCSENDIFVFGPTFNRIPDSYKAIEAYIDDTAAYLQHCQNISHIKPGSYPFIFTPDIVADQALQSLFAGFAPRSLENGTSPLLSKRDSKILNDKFTLLDSAEFIPFDMDGVPTREITFVEKGTLKHFPVMLRSAGKLNMPPTGSNCSSGYGSALQLKAGEKPVKELIKNLDEGVILLMAGDLFMGNIVNGDMSGTIQLGLHVKNGEILGRLKGGSLSFNFYEAFGKNLLEFSKESERFGGSSYIQCPFALVNEIVVN